MIGDRGPEAVIPLRAGRLYVAPVGTPPPPVTGEWWEIGTATYAPSTFVDLDEPAKPPAPLTTRPVSVSFQARLNAEQMRLLFGVPLSLLGPRGRHRARSLTRHKYRARARRKG